MPVAFDRDRTLDVYLPTDANKPPAERPTFVCRHATLRERRAVKQAVFEDVANAVNLEAQVGMLTDQLNKVVVGWRNLPIEYSVAAWPDVMSTPSEMASLLIAWLERTLLSEDDEKNLSSQAASVGEPSAAIAPAASA